MQCSPAAAALAAAAAEADAEATADATAVGTTVSVVAAGHVVVAIMVVGTVTVEVAGGEATVEKTVDTCNRPESEDSSVCPNPQAGVWNWKAGQPCQGCGTKAALQYFATKYR